MFEGSDLTHTRTENQKLMKEAKPFPYQPFRLFTFNYERWLYHTLDLDKNNPRLKRLCSTSNHILFPDVDCTIYIKKTQNFADLMRDLVRAYLPFHAGLMDAIEVTLWDEGDKFLDMTVTSIDISGEDFLVYYNHPDGSPMEVKGTDLGDDEILNLITALVEYNDGNMAKLPMPEKQNQTVSQNIEKEPEAAPMPTANDFYYDPFVEEDRLSMIEDFFL